MAMTPAPDIEEPNAAPVASNVKLPSANTASSATGCCIKCGGTSPFNWCKDYDCPLKYKFAPDIEGLVERLLNTNIDDVIDAATVMREQAKTIRRLREALELYTTICGNTAAMVTRESAKTAYDKARAALAEQK